MTENITAQDTPELAACARGDHDYPYGVGVDLGLFLCIHCRQADTPKWLTVMYVTREYGGAEEGGWWFDVAVPEAYVPLHELTGPEIAQLQAIMEKAYNTEGKPTRYSVRGDGDYRLRFGMEKFQAEPEERPFYC